MFLINISNLVLNGSINPKLSDQESSVLVFFTGGLSCFSDTISGNVAKTIFSFLQPRAVCKLRCVGL